METKLTIKELKEWIKSYVPRDVLMLYAHTPKTAMSNIIQDLSAFGAVIKSTTIRKKKLVGNRIGHQLNIMWIIDSDKAKLSYKLIKTKYTKDEDNE